MFSSIIVIENCQICYFFAKNDWSPETLHACVNLLQKMMVYFHWVCMWSFRGEPRLRGLPRITRKCLSVDDPPWFSAPWGAGNYQILTVLFHFERSKNAGGLRLKGGGGRARDASPLTFQAVSLAVAVLGFSWQLSTSFTLPFPLNVVCLPFVLLEWFLTTVVNFAPATLPGPMPAPAM